MKNIIAVVFFVFISVWNCYAQEITERTMSQIEDYKEEVSEEETRQGQEMDGKWVYVGMSPSEVKAAWGDPDYNEIEYSEGIDERWIYTGEGKKCTVEFDEDKVVNVFAE